MYDLVGKLIRLNESMVDYPRERLDQSMWVSHSGTYKLRDDSKDKIISTLRLYTELDLINLADKTKSGEPEIHITGSICTNQYVDDTDIDVHIVVSPDSDVFGDEGIQDQVKDWFAEDGNRQYIGSHPIEVYLQFNSSQEYLSDGVYNLFTDEWIKGPKVVPLDYDPYDDFSDLFSEISSTLKDVDLGIGELKRDVIDYETMKSAIQYIPPDKRGSIHGQLVSKLREIESDIKELYKERKDLTKGRELSSQPKTPEEALTSVKLAKEWRDRNAVFKFVGRYKYLRIIKDLEQIIDDGIGDQDVDSIKKVVGV